MDTKELKENIEKAMNLLATVDFYSKDCRTLNMNQEKVNKAYNLLFSAKDILIYSIGGDTNEIKQR